MAFRSALLVLKTPKPPLRPGPEAGRRAGSGEVGWRGSMDADENAIPDHENDENLQATCCHSLASAVKREDDEKTSEWYRTMDLAVGSSNGLKKAVRSRQL